MTNNNTKLQVSKEMKEGLDSLIQSSQWSKERIIEHQFTKGFLTEKRKIVNTLTPANLVKALFVGYETISTGKDLISKTPFSDHDVNRLVATYDSIRDAPMMSYNDGIKDGINMALRQTGTKVEGINGTSKTILAEF